MRNFLQYLGSCEDALDHRAPVDLGVVGSRPLSTKNGERPVAHASLLLMVESSLGRSVTQLDCLLSMPIRIMSCMCAIILFVVPSVRW